MAYRDLNEYLAYLDKRGVLRRVEVAVSPNLEIATIAARAKNLADTPALLFQNVANYKMPMLVDVFESAQRLAWGLGLSNLEQLTAFYRDLLHTNPTQPNGDRLLQIGTSSDFVRFSPHLNKNGVCQEVVETNRPEFESLPILQHLPDSPRVLSSVQIYYREPQTGKMRFTLGDLNIVGSHGSILSPHPYQPHSAFFALDFALKSGFPVAIGLGGDPCLSFAGIAPLPAFFDEFTLAGFLRRTRVETVHCKTSDLEVPANAEIVLEGFLNSSNLVKTPTLRTASSQELEVGRGFELTAITSRKAPIFPTTVLGGIPPLPEAGLLKALERAYLPLLQQTQPEIIDLALPLAGAFSNLALVRIKKQYEGQAQKVMHALWGFSFIQTKIIVVVDEECDVQNYSQVLWQVAVHLNISRDMLTFKGPLSPFSPTETPLFGSKLGIDATRPIGEKNPSAQISQETRELVDEKWPSYGID